MFVDSQPADPIVHEAASRMARQIVAVFQGILMEHERAEALLQSYRVAREELERFRREATR